MLQHQSRTVRYIPRIPSHPFSHGIRVGELADFEAFTKKFIHLVEIMKARYGYKVSVDVEAELARYQAFADAMKDYIIDTVAYLAQVCTSSALAFIDSQARKNGKKILIEGANAAMLDLDFGTYPYVTSSSPTIGGCLTGLGVPSHSINRVIGITKAYTSRVGSGPFPTECLDDMGDKLRSIGHEFGTTTGRPRRCGWLDLTQMRYSCNINGYTEIALTKLDILSHFDEIKVGLSYVKNGERITDFPSDLNSLEGIEMEWKSFPGWKEDITKCTKYSELPANARAYIEFIESEHETPIYYIGVGPQREAIVIKEKA